MSLVKVVGHLRQEKLNEYNIEWNIENYFSRLKKPNSCLVSPDFSLWGATWNLQLFPNGAWDSCSVGNVDLYLIRTKSMIRKHKVSFSLGIKNSDGSMYIYDKQRGIFTGICCRRGKTHLVSKSELFQSRDTLASFQDVLTVSCRAQLLDNFCQDACCQISEAEIDIENGKEDNVASTSEIEKNIEDGKEDKAVSMSEIKKNIEDGKEDKAVSTSETEKDVENGKEDKAVLTWEIQNNVGNGKEDKAVSTLETEIDIENGKEDNTASTLESLHILSNDFKHLLLNEEECDVTIKVKNTEFWTHRPILVARSPVFASMFKHDMIERNSNVVNIDDCEADTFKQFLCYLYSGKIEELTLDNVVNLYEIASKYILEDLKKICVQFMQKELTVGSFCDIIAFAVKYSETTLVDCATDFFIKNAKDILVTVKWQIFMKENSTEANELYLKLLIK